MTSLALGFGGIILVKSWTPAILSPDGWYRALNADAGANVPNEGSMAGMDLAAYGSPTVISSPTKLVRLTTPSHDRLEAANTFGTSTAWTLVHVFKMTSVTPYCAFIRDGDFYNDGWALQTYADITKLGLFCTPATSRIGNAWTGNVERLILRHAATPSDELYIDGAPVSLDGASANPIAATKNFGIGCQHESSQGANHDWYETLVFKRTITTGERDLLITYLASTYP